MVDSTYYRRKAAGLCTSCGKRPPVAGYCCCKECMAKHRERGRRHYAEFGVTEERKAYNREWQKMKRRRRQAEGLCIQCGAPRMEGSASYCAKCYIKAQESVARREMRFINEKMAENTDSV